jgi:hypothetical protein
MRFSSLSRSDRLALYILLGGTAFVALTIVVSLWFLNPLLTHLYGGTLYAQLIKLRRHHGPLDYASFVGNSRVLFSRLCLLAVLLDLTIAAWVGRRTMRRLVMSFLTESASPMNLALFRITVFTAKICPHCQSADLRRSRVRWFEWPIKSLIEPIRCRACRCRFWRRRRC